VDLIAEFCLIFILMKISANFVYYYTSYVVCYKNCRCFFLSIKKDRVKKIIEDQAFAPSYELAPPLSSSPLSFQQVVSLSQSSYVSTIK
jgi:hypothetical protein